MLRLELDRATYERCGLVGTPIEDGGRKHQKARFCKSIYLICFDADISLVVELNLRLPSMLHGKKGFERIVWTFKNVLTQSLTWLFVDLKGTPEQEGKHLTVLRYESC